MTNTETAHGNSEAVTMVVEMTVKPEHEQEFLDYVAGFMEKVHVNEPGTLLYVLTRHPTEPHTYLWVERYRDQEALQAHMGAPYMVEPVSRAQDPEWKWWAKPPELLLQLAQVLPK
jgi:quinol monooxygenase YgiN